MATETQKNWLTPLFVAVCLIAAGIAATRHGWAPWNRTQRAESNDAQRSTVGPSGTRPTAKVAPHRYRAVIVAAPRYLDSARNLENVIPSCKKISQAFGKLGYEVVVLAEDDPELKADGGPEATAITILGPPKRANVIDALTAHGRPEATAMTILVLIGHGGLRGGDQYFLTADATAAAGGLGLWELDEMAAAGNWPLVMVVDACRGDLEVADGRSATPEGVADRIHGNLINRGHVDARSIHVSPDARVLPPEEYRAPDPGRPRCTKIFAARYGRAAVDAPNDLINALAEALEVDNRTDRFRADPWRHNPAHAQNETHPLTLMAWFMYGMDKMLLEHKMIWHPVVDVGSVDLMRPLAQANPPGVPTEDVVRGPADIDLLSEWRPEHGYYAFEEKEDGSWKISSSRDRAANEPEPWAGGFVHQKGQGYATTEQAMWVRVVGVPNRLLADAPEQVSLVIDAKYVDQSNHNEWVSAGGQRAHFTVPACRPRWCRVPLIPGKRLNYLAVVDIEPTGSFVMVTHAHLCDAARPVPAEAETYVDLLPRWWLRPDAASPEPAGIGSELVDADRVIHIGRSRLGWAGGVVGPAPWVIDDDAVRVTLENLTAKEVELSVHLKNYELFLGNSHLRLPPGKSEHLVKITDAGPLNYIAIHRPTGDVRVWSMRLAPGRPAVNRAGE